MYNDFKMVVARPEGVHNSFVDKPLDSLTAQEPARETAAAPTMRANPGFVYFIRSGKCGPVKIGYAKAPEHRLIRLQVGNPNELWIVCVVPGSPDDEAAFHRRFAHLRLRGEWFRFAKDLKAAIAPYVAAMLERQIADINRETEEIKALLAQRGASSKSVNGGGTWPVLRTICGPLPQDGRFA